MSIVAESIFIQPCVIVRRKVADVLFIYDLLSSNIIECPDLLCKIGVCSYNYPIRNSNLFYVPSFFQKQKFPPILSSRKRFYFVIEFMTISISFFMSHESLKKKLYLYFQIHTHYYTVCLIITFLYLYKL